MLGGHTYVSLPDTFILKAEELERRAAEYQAQGKPPRWVNDCLKKAAKKRTMAEQLRNTFWGRLGL